MQILKEISYSGVVSFPSPSPAITIVEDAGYDNYVTMERTAKDEVRFTVADLVNDFVNIMIHTTLLLLFPLPDP